MGTTKLILAVLGTVALMAGPAVAKPSRTTAVGKVRGTEAYLAVTYDGVKLRAYACNGSARRLPTIAAWFEASWDGRSPITVVSGGVELRMTSRTGGTLDGHPFTLEAATGPAGLYEQTSGTTTETSVVLANGEIRGTMVPLRPPPKRCFRVTTASGESVVVCSG
jgi:hypothetical protein